MPLCLLETLRLPMPRVKPNSREDLRQETQFTRRPQAGNPIYGKTSGRKPNSREDLRQETQFTRRPQAGNPIHEKTPGRKPNSREDLRQETQFTRRPQAGNPIHEKTSGRKPNSREDPRQETQFTRRPQAGNPIHEKTPGRKPNSREDLRQETQFTRRPQAGNPIHEKTSGRKPNSREDPRQETQFTRRPQAGNPIHEKTPGRKPNSREDLRQETTQDQRKTLDNASLVPLHEVLDLSKETFVEILVRDHLTNTHQEQRITHSELIDEVLTVVGAGYDTTKTTNSLTLIMLALHPKIQQEVYDEIVQVLGDDPETVPTYDQIQELHLLTRVIKETLRLYPAAPIIGRHITSEIQADKYTIPIGKT
ncbi:uncharacterized protein LOC113469679 [Diaphorina citri]|uniref:Uncharacterized protein LOC113469679 n=1 Tax=Diaphorina citri TaxID=121845 RepID=A0A3Q0J4J5_DIACI|nr:uncharacterized protein LOC113469679 [Diaphorina citri]